MVTSSICTPKAIVTCTVATISLIAGIIYYRKRRKAQSVPTKWLPVASVSELLLYPLKSGYRVDLQEAECTMFGFKQITDKAVFKLQDRFLVTYREDDREFRTGRTYPQLVKVVVSNHDINHVALDAPGMRTLYVEVPETSDSKIVQL